MRDAESEEERASEDADDEAEPEPAAMLAEKEPVLARQHSDEPEEEDDRDQHEDDTDVRDDTAAYEALLGPPMPAQAPRFHSGALQRPRSLQKPHAR